MNLIFRALEERIVFDCSDFILINYYDSFLKTYFYEQDPVFFINNEELIQEIFTSNPTPFNEDLFFSESDTEEDFFQDIEPISLNENKTEEIGATALSENASERRQEENEEFLQEIFTSNPASFNEDLFFSENETEEDFFQDIEPISLNENKTEEIGATALSENASERRQEENDSSLTSDASEVVITSYLLKDYEEELLLYSSYFHRTDYTFETLRFSFQNDSRNIYQYLPFNMLEGNDRNLYYAQYQNTDLIRINSVTNSVSRPENTIGFMVFLDRMLSQSSSLFRQNIQRAAPSETEIVINGTLDSTRFIPFWKGNTESPLSMRYIITIYYEVFKNRNSYQLPPTKLILKISIPTSNVN